MLLDALKYLGYAMLTFEIVFALYSLKKLKEVVTRYKILDAKKRDFLLNLRQSFADIFFKGRINAITNILSFETAMLRYALFFWQGNTESTQHEEAYTTHKSSGYGSLMPILLAVVVVELIGVHFLLLYLVNITVATVVTILSAYRMLALLADCVAIIKRPIVLRQDHLAFRLGIRWNVEIPYSAISSVSLLQKVPQSRNEEGLQHQEAVPSFSTLSAGNVVIACHTEIPFLGYYGRKKIVKVFTISVDNPSAFIKSISTKIADIHVGELV